MEPQRLKDIPLFSELGRRDRKSVAEHADEVDVPSGTTLIEQGRLAYEFFVITDGTADILDGDEKIAEVGPGDVLGEIGVLETHKRTATVVATSPMRLVVMYGPELTALKDKIPDVLDRLYAIIRERTPDST